MQPFGHEHGISKPYHHLKHEDTLAFTLRPKVSTYFSWPLRVFFRWKLARLEITDVVLVVAVAQVHDNSVDLLVSEVHNKRRY